MVKCSCSSSHPDTAAAAGSKLIRRLNVRVGNDLSACISNVKGRTLENNASKPPSKAK
jgi:hypothetical protein